MSASTRRLALVVLAVLLVVGRPGDVASAMRVVHAPHVDVLYADPALAAYAQRVAHAAETELEQVAALFGRRPFPIRIRLQGGDDVFNAFALPLPRPHVTFRPLFPIDGTVGFHGTDLTELVLRHEITHLVQLTDTRLPPGSAPLPRVGLVGQGTAVLPPAWLLEGIAVWVESSAGPGGRLHDARTRALLWTLAADGSMPSLTDVSLISYRRWPDGRARYLLGASFIDFLVREHGFDALVKTLHVFQAGDYLLPFETAWKRAVGTDLNAEWAAWARDLAAQAKRRSGLVVPSGLEPASATLGAPALAPGGHRLAWAVGGGVRVATVGTGTGGPATVALRDARTIPTRLAAEGLTWLDDHTLVLAAVGRDPGRYPSDLFALDVNNGAIRRLTDGAHAHLPRADGHGCVLYVRDVVPEGASLRRWCTDRPDAVVWTAPSGTHIVGVAVSRGGRVALSLYRAGTVDLALLGPGGVRRLTADAASELDPTWLGEDALLFSSDASGLFQLEQVAVGATVGSRAGHAVPAGPLTKALGGAMDAVPVAGGWLYRTLDGDGYVLAWRPAAGASGRGATTASGGAGAAVGGGAASVPSGAAGSRSGTAPVTGVGTGGGVSATAAATRYPDRPYRAWPSLLPYGWWPSGGRLSLRPLGAGLELSAVGLDDSARHALDFTVGYDTALSGPLGGAYGYVRYGWNMPNPVRAPGPPPVAGFAVQAGSWPYGPYLEAVDETAFGVRADALLRAPVGRYAGSLALSVAALDAPSLPGWRPDVSVDAVLDARSADTFGAVSGGERFALRGRWSYGPAGPSAGLWGEAGWWPTLAPSLVGRLELSAGYRPLPPVPVTLPDVAAIASVGARLSIPVRWRWADGMAALERVDLTPTARLWAGTEPGTPGWRAGAGGDVGVWADTVLDYDAVVRFGVIGGYAEGWWARVGVGLPF